MATTINANHRKAFEHLLETKGTEQFRRSDLAKTIYPLTNPRSRERSEDIATALIHEAAQGGRLQRRGHLHWVYFIGVGIAALIFAWQLWVSRRRERDACFAAFRSNNWVGLALWLGMMLAYALK